MALAGAFFILFALGLLAVGARALELRTARRKKVKKIKKVVLIVDDAPDNQVLIGAMLKKTGAMVETAKDGEEGVQKALAVQPDAVIMDVQMPRMNGFEATTELRRRGFSKPIISCTSRSVGDEEERAYFCGANAHLAKPVERQKLLGLLGQLWSFA